MSKELIDLQTQLSFQEDAIAHLDKVVTQQQQEILTLKKMITKLQQHIEAIQPANFDNSNVPPPHF